MFRRKPKNRSDDANALSLWNNQLASLTRCEERLLMSAVPLLDFFHHDMVSDLGDSSPERLEVCHAAAASQQSNFNLTDDVTDSSADDYAPVAQSSAAHQQTGWDTVAANYGLRGDHQTVAVIDSGIAWDHVALGQGFGPGYRVVGGWDFAEGDANPYDDRPAGFHGTHVAGIIGADDPTRSGVAPDVDLVALRVFDDSGHGNMLWVEQALQWVHQNRNAFDSPITTVNLSLGSTWNSDTVPSWSTLEDDFQNLRSDGIVVVVSAGNSFKTYNTTGLSYPAASPLVIPVASVDANDVLSDFSQRNDRVIAAPGRNILSTVPDHVLGSDGVINDWANASGTSMAAPYVAGAAVLIREAMEMAGWSSITPEGIYQWMRNTSDSIYDSLTRMSYDRLDLESAISQLLPADQVGDQLNSAQTISLSHHFTSDGWINTLGDRDVYRFTPSTTGSLEISASSDWLHTNSWTAWNGTSELSSDQLQIASDGSLHLNVVAGQSYAIAINDNQQIGPYTLDWNFQQTSTGEANPPSTGSGQNGASITGNDPSQYGITVQGSALHITGTANTDRYTIDVHQGLNIAVSGQTFHYNLAGDGAVGSSISSITIDLQDGDDHVDFIGSSGSEKIQLSPTTASIENAAWTVTISGTEQIVVDGGGGYDRGYLSGGAGDDTITLKPQYAELIGGGYRFEVNAVASLYVDATQGGQDWAYFYDSNGDDRLSVRPQFSSMASDSFFNYASGVERVYAYSNAGGSDSATLYDSVGNDAFNTNGDVASIVGTGFFSYTRYFENVEAVASAGGTDVASIYATTRDSLLVGGDYGGYRDANWGRIARGFETTNTYLDNQIINLRNLSEESALFVEGTVAADISSGSITVDSGSSADSLSESAGAPNLNIADASHFLYDEEFLVAHSIDADIHQSSQHRFAMHSTSIEYTPQFHDRTSESSFVNSSGIAEEAVQTDAIRLDVASRFDHIERLLLSLDEERVLLDAVFAEHGLDTSTWSPGENRSRS